MAKKRNRSAMRHDFSMIPAANIPRSVFNLSHAHKTTFDAGYLIPHFVQEVLPGDTHSVTCHKVVRLATPLKPIMDHIAIEDFYFFVPNRLVWQNWLKFCGEQDDPGDSTDFTIPSIPTNTSDAEFTQLADYMGIPPVNGISVSALPFRAINLIWNQWFRAQDLQDSLPRRLGDTGDARSEYKLVRRGKRHDYFTSALPWPQFGPGVDLPLGTTAPVFLAGAENATIRFGSSTDNDPQNATGVAGLKASALDVAGTKTANLTGDYPDAVTVWADLQDASAATINELRQAFQIQRLQERDARGGHRYQEIVLSHFGVRGGDARLNRSEYLGGSTISLGIVQIPQTSGTAANPETPYTDDPQGNLAAYGVATGSGGFTKSFTEHGYIIGFVNARADLTYQRGLDRHWSRRTKYDFYWPALARLGEQAILNIEIFAQGNPTDAEVFGYQERWAELRFTNSKITGLFRSTNPASLDVWHLSQDFATLPALNDTFIQDDPPIDRVIAVPDEPHFIADFYFKHKAVRPMPVHSVPGMIDHF